MRTQSSRDNDGFLDHVARRGTEKAATGCGGILGVVLLLIVVGAVIAATHDPWPLVGVVLAVGYFMHKGRKEQR